MKKQVQKEKRGNYGFPYFGGGGFCSFEKAKVVKWLKVGRLCAAGYRMGIKEMIGKFGLCFLLWDNHVLPRNLCWEIGNIFGYLRVGRNINQTLCKKTTKLI